MQHSTYRGQNRKANVLTSLTEEPGQELNQYLVLSPSATPELLQAVTKHIQIAWWGGIQAWPSMSKVPHLWGLGVLIC